MLDQQPQIRKLSHRKTEIDCDDSQKGLKSSSDTLALQLPQKEAKEEEKSLQNSPYNMLKDSSRGAAAMEGNTEEHLEPRLNEVASIDSFESDGKFAQSLKNFRSDAPKSDLLDQESYYLHDDEAPLNESSVSMGYFPCYQTYAELPQYHPPDGDASHRDEAEKQLGSSRDASIQCGECLEAEVHRWEKTGVEANSNCKEAKLVFAHPDLITGQPRGSSRPGSSGRKLEGSRGRQSLRHGESSPEAGSSPKEREEKLGKEKAPKPRRPGSSISQPNVKTGVTKDVPGLGSQSSPLPSPVCGRKSPRKKQHKSCWTNEKDQAKEMELKQSLLNQRSLPPSPEEKSGLLHTCWYGVEAAGENSELQPVIERVKESHPATPLALSCSSAPLASSPSESRPSPSRRSIRSFISWIWNIFRKSSPTPPQPSTSTEAENGSRQTANWLSVWIAQHRSRVHPHQR